MNNFTLLTLSYIIIVIAVAIRVLYRQKDTGTTMAWLVILFSLPFVGVLVYFVFGETRMGYHRQKRGQQISKFYDDYARTYLNNEDFFPTKPNIPDNRLGIHSLASVSSLTASDGNAMTLLTTTDDIVSAMVADIQAATSSVFISFYIIDPQGRIEMLLSAIEQASRRGVDCIILADAMGSRGFFKSQWIKILSDAGVQIHESLPVGRIRTFLNRIDLRNHRKIVIIDKQIGYTGSFNLVDPALFKQDSDVGQWVDVMMRCRGTLVLELTAVFYADVAIEADENLAAIKDRLITFATDSTQLPVFNTYRMVGNITAQVIPSGPDMRENAIYRTIIQALYSAQRSITITTPYFVPDDSLLLALTNASRRGVKTTLIVPKKVDSLLVRYTSQAYFPKLLQAGVQIARFHGGLLHTKTLVIDDDFTLFGTVNMDMRSFFLNLEISLGIYDKNMTAQIIALQNNYLQDSDFINIEHWRTRSPWWGLLENLARLLSPLL